MSSGCDEDDDIATPWSVDALSFSEVVLRLRNQDGLADAVDTARAAARIEVVFHMMVLLCDVWDRKKDPKKPFGSFATMNVR